MAGLHGKTGEMGQRRDVVGDPELHEPGHVESREASVSITFFGDGSTLEKEEAELGGWLSTKRWDFWLRISLWGVGRAGIELWSCSSLTKAQWPMLFV